MWHALVAVLKFRYVKIYYMQYVHVGVPKLPIHVAVGPMANGDNSNVKYLNKHQST